MQEHEFDLPSSSIAPSCCYDDDRAAQVKVVLGNPRFEGAVTTIMVEPGISALRNVIGAVSLHFQEGESPLWVETDDEQLRADIEAHYDLKKEEER